MTRTILILGLLAAAVLPAHSGKASSGGGAAIRQKRAKRINPRRAVRAERECPVAPLVAAVESYEPEPDFRAMIRTEWGCPTSELAGAGAPAAAAEPVSQFGSPLAAAGGRIGYFERLYDAGALPDFVPR